MTVRTSYIQTDLDLYAAFDLRPLVEELERLGLTALNSDDLGGDGSWKAILEADGEEEETPTDPNVPCGRMLAAISALPPRFREDWRRCDRRVFNLGFDCGEEPWPYTVGLSPEVTRGLASVGGELEFTLYPFRPDRNPGLSDG
ncbi:hypothetical protein [Alienimonas sp. DA493]|uniref:hypothetical protein n=1 Tax=Alienimonas sp. DA493 TaxID=3373605 RepID=UPI003753F7F7